MSRASTNPPPHTCHVPPQTSTSHMSRTSIDLHLTHVQDPAPPRHLQSDSVQLQGRLQAHQEGVRDGGIGGVLVYGAVAGVAVRHKEPDTRQALLVA